MFGIGGSELLLIVLAILLLFGPDKIPQFARKAGRLYADFKRYTGTMESIIRMEINEGEKESDADAKEAAEKAEAAKTPEPVTFEDEDDEDEEEEG